MSSSSSSSESRSPCLSEPHSYNIQAKLRNGILSIFVHDTMTNFQWRQEFTQISFPGHKIYDVAKALIMAIQEMINNTNNKQQQQQDTNINHNDNNNDNKPKPIAILVYNQWCYLSITNSNLPSFALRPIENTENKSKQNRSSNKQQQTPYGFNSNKSSKNIKFGDIQRDKRINHNIKFKDVNNTSNTSNTSTPSVISQGLVARNIARFNKKEKQYKSNSSNSRKKHTKINKTKKCKKKKQQKPSSSSPSPPPKAIITTRTSSNLSPLPPIRPPTPSNMDDDEYHHHISIITNESDHENELPALPPSSPRSSSHRLISFASRPLPTLPSLPSLPMTLSTLPTLPIAQKMTVKNMDHTYSRSVKFGHSLTPSIQPRHSGFHHYNNNNNDSIPSIHNLSSSSSSDFDDGLVINSDDDLEDSSSYKYEGRDNGSMDSNSGSLDSLFTNDGIINIKHHDLEGLHGLDDYDGFDGLIGLDAPNKKESIVSINSNNTFFNGSYESTSSKSLLPAKKMRLFNVITNIDVDEQNEDEEEEEFRSDLFECDNNKKSRFRSNKMWDMDHHEMNDGELQKTKKQKIKKKGKKSKNKKIRSNKPLRILLNGDVIENMINHVIEQQIAEEEYYEEEDQADEPFYDPNLLGISPYYED